MLVLFITLFVILVSFKYILYRKLQDIDGLGALTRGMSESDKIISVFEEEKRES